MGMKVASLMLCFSMDRDTNTPNYEYPFFIAIKLIIKDLYTRVRWAQKMLTAPNFRHFEMAPLRSPSVAPYCRPVTQGMDLGLAYAFS